MCFGLETCLLVVCECLGLMCCLSSCVFVYLVVDKVASILDFLCCFIVLVILWGSIKMVWLLLVCDLLLGLVGVPNWFLDLGLGFGIEFSGLFWLY